MDPATHFGGTWGIGLWQSPVLSTRGYNAVVLVNERARKEERWKGNSIPCESCDRISQTLGTYVPDGQLVIVSSKDFTGVLHRLHSSPGYLQVGHVPSKWTWQMPQTSSSGRSHRQVATAFHFLILTFISTVFFESLRSLRA